MRKSKDPIVEKNKNIDFTRITFVPDLAKFSMEHLNDNDTIALITRRAYDIAASTTDIKVYLNDHLLSIKKFKDYCNLYLPIEYKDTLIYEKLNNDWEFAVAFSAIGFKHVSFVNNIATTNGGCHVETIVDPIVKHIRNAINKKKNTQNFQTYQIKNQLFFFINCLIDNPTFDSPTKDTLIYREFNPITINKDTLKKINDKLLAKIKTSLENKETDLVVSNSKLSKVIGISKLDNATYAGTNESINCTLIVTDGDSAKNLAVVGLVVGVIGRDRYGVYQLKGKILNVLEASKKQILDNKDFQNILKIIGLNYKEKYETMESLKSLRYGKLMIMTDQDHDGYHVKGLIINFIHYQWPNLLKHGFVEEFITPIIKVTKASQEEQKFYSMPEFDEWQLKTENWNLWKIKYYKGLSSFTSREAIEYFSDMQRHRIKFNYIKERDDKSIQLAYREDLLSERQEWLTKYMEERKQNTNRADDYLYQKNAGQISFCDFVNKKLVSFSNLDNERYIPSLVDGFKPDQRKVMFTCFKRNLVQEIKVIQLAGAVAELSSYNHGEESLLKTIINLAQNFVGSNNFNLLFPIGQFGSRIDGGKNFGKPDCIFTALHPLTRLLFNPKDDPLLNYTNDNGQLVEPDFYCPIIPTVLVNGAEGNGTEWSTRIPNYNPRDIIQNLKCLINGEQTQLMLPYFKNFQGQINRIDDTNVITSGKVVVIDENTIEITELPISVWTQEYKDYCCVGLGSQCRERMRERERLYL
jgi:DNA topoisomerase-2